MNWIFALLGYAVGRRNPQTVVLVNQAALERQRQAKRNLNLFVLLAIAGWLFWYFGAPGPHA